MTLIYLSSAWVAGIYLGSRASISIRTAVAATAVLLIAALAARKHSRPCLVLLCLALLFAGAARYRSTVPPVNDNTLAFYNGSQKATITGVVGAEPDRRDRVTLLRVNVHEIEVAGAHRPISGAALVTVAPFPTYRYGDLLSITGTLEAPQKLGDFNYPDYLARQGISSVANHPQVKLLASGRGFPPQAWILSLKERLSRSLASSLPEPQGSLAQGILLGTRSSVPDDLNDAFIKSGTSHILAISGYNIAIVIGVVSSFGLWLLSRRATLVLTLAAVALFTMLTGAEPPVVRAAVMGTLVVIATATGRRSSALTSLAFAAALMVGLSPGTLWSVSFQLSFLSILGLIALAPPLTARGQRAVASLRHQDIADPERSLLSSIIESTAVTLSAIIATAPLIAYYFHRGSLVAPLANLLGVPALPPAMLTSAAVSILGLVNSHLAQAAGWVAWLSLSYLMLVVRLFARLPLASVDIGIVGAWVAWAYYGALALIVWPHRPRLPQLRESTAAARRRTAALASVCGRIPAKWVAAPLAVLAILVWAAAFVPRDGRYHVDFLDVGQGDAILIRTPQGHNVLVDGGPSPQAIGSVLGKELPFYDRKIDMVVLTHPQEDHIGGLIEAVKRYKVGKAIELAEDTNSPLYREWRQELDSHKVQRVVAQAGQRVPLGKGAWIDVIYPDAAWASAPDRSINDLSLVLRLVLGNVSLLLTGDLEESGETYLVGKGIDLGSTILKVGHHGSNTSTSERFLRAVGPRLAVISVGADNHFGHPTPETLQRLAGIPIFRTDRQGTIDLSTDGRRLWVKTESPISK
ncbi:MAG: DNA internalization-related competence protein ComEC/Rec2 [Chloroflexi bacterium]|nr:DNA internalization-related competence protein ComEC/Rec2 [Chloroflexota bacterium]